MTLRCRSSLRIVRTNRGECMLERGEIKDQIGERGAMELVWNE